MIISFSRGSSRPRDRTQVSFNLWATREASWLLVLLNPWDCAATTTVHLTTLPSSIYPHILISIYLQFCPTPKLFNPVHPWVYFLPLNMCWDISDKSMFLFIVSQWNAYPFIAGFSFFKQHAVCMHIHVLNPFICSRHLGCFYLLALMNNVALNFL